MADATTPTLTEQDIRRRAAIASLNTATEENPLVAVVREYHESKSLDDPFKNHYSADAGGSLQPLEPTFSFHALMRLPNENSTLAQCIDAMVTNVDGHGYMLYYVGPEGKETSLPARREKAALMQLLEYPNDSYTFGELRNRLRRDYETLGFLMMEVVRAKSGKVVGLNHLPAHTMRRTARDKEPVRCRVPVPRDNEDTATINKRFCRFIQLVGDRRVYFKEFGDPRVIDPQTGQVNTSLSVEDSATEVIYFSRYTPGSPYGLPRWFNQLPAVMGSRQAELTNLDFFKENAIPAMVLLVSGGLVTEESIKAIENSFRNARGRKSMNRVAIVEVAGDVTTASESGAVAAPRVEMKPLQGERQGDALFQTYEANNADKIRSAFRLPPIFLGLSGDYTFATARTSYEIAEGQVFRPERKLFDDMINRMVLATYRPTYWQFRSMPPRLAAREDIIRAVNVFERVGALTPNVAIQMANEFFDLEITPVGEFWGDYPFALIQTLAQTGQLDSDAMGELGKLFLDPETPAPPPGSGDPGDKGGRPSGVGNGEGTGQGAAPARKKARARRLLAGASTGVQAVRALLDEVREAHVADV
jgi:PBSX family phage portal protein